LVFPGASAGDEKAGWTREQVQELLLKLCFHRGAKAREYRGGEVTPEDETMISIAKRRRTSSWWRAARRRALHTYWAGGKAGSKRYQEIKTVHVARRSSVFIQNKVSRF
jgi:hypothetical protein